MDVFGSVLRSDYRPGESNIDLLVEFLPLDSGSLYKAYFALLNDLRLGWRSRGLMEACPLEGLVRREHGQ